MSLSGDIISNMNMEAEISAIGEISGEVDLSGAGTTPHIVASATVSPDPGIPSCNVVRSGTDETPNFTFNFEGLKGEPGEQGEQGEAGTDGTDGVTPSVSATASVSPVTGTPSVVVTRSGTDAAPNFDFAFAGLKGERGAKGDTGEAGPVGPTGADGVTPDISATASVSNTTGTPSVVVTKTGADLNPNFDFAFENIKGEQGVQGDPGRNGADGVDGVTPIISATASADNVTGIPNVVITRSGTDTAPNFDFAFHNIKGEKGDTGEGVPDDVGASIGSVVTHTATGNEWVLPSADNTRYDNTQSGLTATKVQGAIDENASAISSLNSSLTNKADLASPTFTGTPKAPTATSGTSTTQIATTAFVDNAVGKQVIYRDVTISSVTATVGSVQSVDITLPSVSGYSIYAASVRSASGAANGNLIIIPRINSNYVTIANIASGTITATNIVIRYVLVKN